MKTLFTVLKKIVWKDIFKPRYILLVTIYDQVLGLQKVNGKFVITNEVKRVPCIIDKPYKRDLSTPFNVFYNEMSSRGLAIAGSRRTLMKLYGVGSVLPHNINNPNYFYPSMTKTG